MVFNVGGNTGSYTEGTKSLTLNVMNGSTQLISQAFDLEIVSCLETQIRINNPASEDPEVLTLTSPGWGETFSLEWV